MVEYNIEGRSARAYLATPPGGAGPGVLVLHAWWGLTPFFKGVCDRLAAEGFVALAPDLYDGATAATIDEAKALIGQVDFDAVTHIVLGAVELLRAQAAAHGDRLGVVGFAMGAAWSLLLASVLAPGAVGAVVVFYGHDPSVETDDYARSGAAFLGHFALGAPWDPDDEVRRT